MCNFCNGEQPGDLPYLIFDYRLLPLLDMVLVRYHPLSTTGPCSNSSSLSFGRYGEDSGLTLGRSFGRMPRTIWPVST